MLLLRPASFLLLACAGCNVDATVGYVESTVVGGIACSDDALRRCDSGACAVTSLFEPPAGAITLAADDTDVFYLTNPQSIGKHALAGDGESALAEADSTLMRMAADRTHVYWTELDGNVRGVPKSGGARFEASYVFGNPTELTVDATHLYWVFPEFGQVAMAPKPSGPATHISGQASPEAITTDATHVYWVNSGTGPLTGELVRAARGDLTSLEVVLSGLDAPLTIAAAEDAIYFASQTALFRWVKGASLAEILATDFSDVKAIAVYGSTVYGAGMEGFWRVPVTGGTWQELERRPMSGLTLACSGVYVTGWFESALLRYGP